MAMLEDAEFLTIARQAVLESRLYRMVDPSNASERALSAKAQKSAGLIRNAFYVQTPSQKLYLQPIPPETRLGDELAKERQQRSDKLLQPVAFGGWVITSQPLSMVVSYVTRQLTQITPEGKKALLRFHDPRVLARLEAILHREQLSALLGPIDQWIYLDNTRVLQSIAPHGEQRHLGRLNLTLPQWSAIRRIGQLNRCLELYRTLPEEDKAGPADAATVDTLLVAAQHCGLKDRQDIATFVLHGLVISPTFYQHPIMQALLSARQAPDSRNTASYIGLSNKLNDSDWDKIMESREMV